MKDAEHVSESSNSEGKSTDLTTHSKAETIDENAIEEKIIDEIGGALWRNIYVCREDVTEEHILDFAR